MEHVSGAEGGLVGGGEGGGLKRSSKSVQGKSPEAVEAAVRAQGQWEPSADLLGGESRKPCEQQSV